MKHGIEITKGQILHRTVDGKEQRIVITSVGKEGAYYRNMFKRQGDGWQPIKSGANRASPEFLATFAAAH